MRIYIKGGLKMKFFYLTLSVLGLLLGNLVGSQQTEEQRFKFGGFEGLFRATDVIAVVQFEARSTLSFQVLEVLYPKKSDTANFFAAYKGSFYGMLINEHGRDPSPVLVPSGKYILCLKRIPESGRRDRYVSRSFQIPAYAGSYTIAPDLPAAVPLFDFDSTDSIPMNAYRAAHFRTFPGGVSSEADQFIGRYAKKPLMDAYGTLDPHELEAAFRGLLSIAAGRRLYPDGEVAAELSGNNAFQAMTSQVMEGGKFKAGIFTYPEVPDLASREPPARAWDISVLRNSYLAKVKIPEFKVEETSVVEALAILEGMIKKEPGYEEVRFVLSEALLNELKESKSKISFHALKGEEAAAILTTVAFEMYVELRKDQVVFIDRL